MIHHQPMTYRPSRLHNCLLLQTAGNRYKNFHIVEWNCHHWSQQKWVSGHTTRDEQAFFVFRLDDPPSWNTRIYKGMKQLAAKQDYNTKSLGKYNRCLYFLLFLLGYLLYILDFGSCNIAPALLSISIRLARYSDIIAYVTLQLQSFHSS